MGVKILADMPLGSKPLGTP